MDGILDRKHAGALFADRAVVLTDLAAGMPRDLVARVDAAVGRRAEVPGRRADYDAPFDAAATGVGARRGSR